MIKRVGIKERVRLSGQALEKYPDWIEENNVFQGGGVKREEVPPVFLTSQDSGRVAVEKGFAKRVQR
ncbi:MAG: hypothetical protein RI841_03205 [Halomonas sp.]|uniref:hypothetical protein n=1 Tax=Halomonas sp. TaxID=1486246 RepID=UPI00287064CC|nr:hypothetical protein [Halomonas sp.]MDR9438495.1 hypothetical protein [Halomonas sp.]